MAHSPAVAFLWKLAATEARNNGATAIEPVCFLIAICKGIERAAIAGRETVGVPDLLCSILHQDDCPWQGIFAEMNIADPVVLVTS